MRPTRMLLAAGAASAVLAITTPGVYAVAGEWDHEDSSYSKEHDKDSRHDAPRGGMHTGGGALTTVNNDEEWDGSKDSKHDPESHQDESDGYNDSEHGSDRSKGHEDGSDGYQDSEHGSDHFKDSKEDAHDSFGGDHDKPRGGMHTGGGALDTPTVTTAGLAVLAVAGTGLYAVRRNKSVRNAA
ncbi:hypothetical protein [Streptomyces sp. NL15-2K]|uniref:hypothetical protein n=1 Tax=Streptomyces sp. NL15-2K TaxID=376149 RepID=UPI000F562F2E|nr:MULTISPECIES: hypothetical protein [Actinomycetes]WKX06367.1 hypothetical protein Q4V64_02220 [Kutzneria buriramensis]GCB43363.1 arginine/ornithine antiporter arcD [Streptomyces sp. NL15-2K]